MRAATRLLPAFVLIAALAAGTPVTATPARASAPRNAAASLSQRATTLAPGVTYRTYMASKSTRVRLITVDLAQGATIDVALARQELPGWARTSAIAVAHNALAAVNGDFGLPPGRPGHALAQDGELIQTSVLGKKGKNFAVSIDGSGAHIGIPTQRITVTQPATGEVFTVDRWNGGAPGAGEIAGFTPAGGSVERPPAGCAVHLTPAGDPTWAASERGIGRDYSVDASACGNAMGVGDGVVLVASLGGTEAQRLQALQAGDTVRLVWSFGWPMVLDSIGGNPLLVKNGQPVIGQCLTYLCRRNGRTAVGVTADGKVILVQMDGRFGTPAGMTLATLAREMVRLGAVDALNLDGSGSSTMWIKGRGVVNQPSDGYERPVTTALLVLPGLDPQDPPTLLPP